MPVYSFLPRASEKISPRNWMLSPTWSLQPRARGPRVSDHSAAGRCSLGVRGWQHCRFELRALLPGAEGKLALERFLFPVELP